MKGYFKTNYRNHSIEVEKLDGEWWITIDNQSDFEPRLLRRWALDSAKAHIDAEIRADLRESRGLKRPSPTSAVL